jgi:hypothetical protein
VEAFLAKITEEEEVSVAFSSLAATSSQSVQIASKGREKKDAKML